MPRQGYDSGRMRRWKRAAAAVALASGITGLAHGQRPEVRLARLPLATPVLEPPQPAGSGGLAPQAAVGERPSEKLTWWHYRVQEPLREDDRHVAVSVDSLVVAALQHSAKVRVLSDGPLIQETAIIEADAAFDWTHFIDSRWDAVSQPVGNALTTGGPPRFRDRNLYGTTGLRRRNTLGGEVEFSQRVGFQNNNSNFFIPGNQGTTRLALSYTQPLLRGAGNYYNTSVTLLARLEADVAMDQFTSQLQDYLLDVARAYWGLYLERGALLQKRRLYERAVDILDQLESRQALGTLMSQLVRARAAVETRRSELIRAEMAVRNAEARIRALVNDPELGTSQTVELIPVDIPESEAVPIDLEQSLTLALQHRPDIMAAIREVKAAAVRLKIAKNEVLPALNLVLLSYVSGLRGGSDVGQSFIDMFSVGEPSYGIGIQYQRPLWNRAAQARLTRRQLEMRQLQSQFRAQVENVKLDVEVAGREINTALKEVEMKRSAVQARRDEVEYVRQRWQLLPEDENTASLMLESLLTAQEELARAEYDYLSANVALNLAQINHKRAMGLLLEAEEVMMARACAQGAPVYLLDKSPSAEAPPDGQDAPSGHGNPPIGPPDQGPPGPSEPLPVPLPVLPAPQ